MSMLCVRELLASWTAITHPKGKRGLIDIAAEQPAFIQFFKALLVSSTFP
jgi:hypothetical protein